MLGRLRVGCAMLLLGCASSGPEPWLEAESPDVPILRASIASLGGIGLSGITLDGSGRLWAIPERKRVLVALAHTPSGELTVREVPLSGVAEDLELESIAWIGERRFAIGTERRAARTTDRVLLATVDDDGAEVDGDIVLDYGALWGIVAPSNEGIEGLCYSAGQLVAAGEPVLVRDGKRYAPVARRLIQDGHWVPHLVELTSTTGKLSALDCQISPRTDSLYMLAVERHYGVARIVHFVLPLANASVQRASLLSELGPRLGRIPNVEGIARQGNQIILMTDHDTVGQAGATESITVGPFDSDDELEAAEPDD